MISNFFKKNKKMAAFFSKFFIYMFKFVDSGFRFGAKPESRCVDCKNHIFNKKYEQEVCFYKIIINESS